MVQLLFCPLADAAGGKEPSLRRSPAPLGSHAHPGQLSPLSEKEALDGLPALDKQHIEPMTHEQALSFVTDKLHFAANFVQFGGLLEKEYVELNQHLQTGEIAQARHWLLLQVISASEQGLRDDVAEVRRYMAEASFGVRVDCLIRDRLYFSRFSPLRAGNVRGVRMTSAALTQLMSFTSADTGLGTCAWGAGGRS